MAPLLATGCLVGCAENPSAVAPAGPQATRLAELIWLLTGLGTAVYLLVVGALLYALVRGARRERVAEGPEVERRLRHWVGGAVVTTAVILLSLLLVNFNTGRAIAGFRGPQPLTIKVTGHQWWWEVEYLDPQPGRRVTTANEIHLPVGRRIQLQVASADVIHSFWVPNLHGKLDLIPGYSGTTHLQVDRAGTYRGRCAEFCGLQHAKMDLRVIAQSPAEFSRWYEHQLGSAAPATTPLQEAGQRVFLTKSCVLCHTIRGTPAGSRVGPDLTHLASRATIAAGTLPNTRGHLAGWILDPQSIKPGVRMPPNQLSPDELHALLGYLENLE